MEAIKANTLNPDQYTQFCCKKKIIRNNFQTVNQKNQHNGTERTTEKNTNRVVWSEKLQFSFTKSE